MDRRHQRKVLIPDLLSKRDKGGRWAQGPWLPRDGLTNLRPREQVMPQEKGCVTGKNAGMWLPISLETLPSSNELFVIRTFHSDFTGLRRWSLQNNWLRACLHRNVLRVTPVKLNWSSCTSITPMWTPLFQYESGFFSLAYIPDIS